MLLLLPFIIRIKVGVWTEICSGADSRLYEPVEIGRFSAMLTCEGKKRIEVRAIWDLKTVEEAFSSADCSRFLKCCQKWYLKVLEKKGAQLKKKRSKSIIDYS